MLQRRNPFSHLDHPKKDQNRTIKGALFTEKVVLDAQALFFLQRKKIPRPLEELRIAILNGTTKVIIPTIAIAELLWKMRKWGELPKFRKALDSWTHSPNILIDSFDLTILESMAQNVTSAELHDEIIAMTCKKHNVSIVYSNDESFERNYGLTLRTF